MAASETSIHEIVQQEESVFRAQMIEYIKAHFADVLGDDIKLLDLPNGLDILAEKLGLTQISKAA
ncbi:MAG: hypothetical protein ACYS8W_16915 [Planctomycetota bacterium]|jgi:hypothetical protein